MITEVQKLKRRLLTLLALCMVFVIATVSLTIQLFSAGADLNQRHYELEKLSNKVSYLDQVLTLSTYLGATTKDEQWQKHHAKHASELEKILQEASEVDPVIQSLVTRTKQSNDKLIELETKAFVLAQQGKLDEAIEVLEGATYRSYKAAYASGVESAMNKIKVLEQQSLADSYRSRGQELKIAALALMLVFGGFCYFLVRYLAASEKLLKQSCAQK